MIIMIRKLNFGEDANGHDGHDHAPESKERLYFNLKNFFIKIFKKT